MPSASVSLRKWGTYLGMRYTLMNQGHEVLDFEFDSGSGRTEVKRMLEGVAWAPMGLPVDGRDASEALDRFLRRRALDNAREDTPHILRACGVQSTVELALRSGGFSLADQYWYRGEGSPLTWEGSNFFDNEWDCAFGEAVLRRDYDALADSSICTPDVTLGGFCRKAWVQTDRGLCLLKASPMGDDANIYCEALASRMLDRLVGACGHVPYEPVSFGSELYSSCPLRVGRNEELVSGTQLLSKAGVDVGRIDAQTGLSNFESFMSIYLQLLEDQQVAGARQAMAKLFVMATLALDFDTHPANFGLMRDVRTLKLREAPLFDHGRAFIFLKDKFDLIRRKPIALDLIVGLYFSHLDPTWDYSWYDPHALDGFEDDIRESLSTLDSFPEGYAELMADLFVRQHDYVNRVAESSRHARRNS